MNFSFLEELFPFSCKDIFQRFLHEKGGQGGKSKSDESTGNESKWVMFWPACYVAGQIGQGGNVEQVEGHRDPSKKAERT